MLNKKILFFDGDGTMWYPKSTKRTKAPHWIYTDEQKKDGYLQHLTLTPTARDTIRKLKSQGYILILLSAHPHPPTEATKILQEKMDHFEYVFKWHRDISDSSGLSLVLWSNAEMTEIRDISTHTIISVPIHSVVQIDNDLYQHRRPLQISPNRYLCQAIISQNPTIRD